MPELIDGKKVAESVFAECRVQIGELAARGITPGLAVVLVGHDPDFSDLAAALCGASYMPLKKGALARIDLSLPARPGSGVPVIGSADLDAPRARAVVRYCARRVFMSARPGPLAEAVGSAAARSGSLRTRVHRPGLDGEGSQVRAG